MLQRVLTLGERHYVSPAQSLETRCPRWAHTGVTMRVQRIGTTIGRSVLKGGAMLVVVRRSNALSACSLGFKAILSKRADVSRLQMEASTPAAASLSRRTSFESLAVRRCLSDSAGQAVVDSPRGARVLNEADMAEVAALRWRARSSLRSGAPGMARDLCRLPAQLGSVQLRWLKSRRAPRRTDVRFGVRGIDCSA